jgi:heat-inducible transcriptional repressor
MPSDPNIGKREREVLTAIVETFISTGEPVGSRTLSRSNREGLSPASIRNVMADLSDAGFLEQPHASAGRIPTTEAYRYYVEQISGTAKLAPQEENMISDSLAGISDVQEFMERTSHVLSLISRNVGVTVASSGTKNALEHVYFSRLGDQKVLAVLVTRSGLVRDRVLRLDLKQDELDLAGRYINDNFRGWTIESMRAELARRIEQERSEYDRLMNSIEQLYKQGALAADAATQVVFVEGAANLVTSQEDRQRLQEMLQTLEEKEKVAKLLGAYLDVKQ